LKRLSALCEAPNLQVPNFDKAFVLATDASDVAVSAILYQDVNGVLAPNAYHSRVMNAAVRKYRTYEECLNVLFGCEKCRPYLEHKEFLLHCDNLVLCWLLRKPRMCAAWAGGFCALPRLNSGCSTPVGAIMR